MFANLSLQLRFKTYYLLQQIYLPVRAKIASEQRIAARDKAAWARSRSGFCFCTAIITSPLLTGANQPWLIDLIMLDLLLAFALWTASMRWRPDRGLPGGGRWLSAIVGGLLLYMVASLLHPTNHFDSIPRKLRSPELAGRWWPSTVDAYTSIVWIFQHGPILLAVVAMSDLCRSSMWRDRIFASLAGSGIALSLYGLGQKAHLLPALSVHAGYPASSFASFLNHGDAGAWLNLSLAASLILALKSVGKPRTQWMIGTAIIFIAAMVNISKISRVFSTFLLAYGAWRFLLDFQKARSSILYRRKLFGFLAVVVAIILTLLITRRLIVWQRMSQSLQADSGRRIMWNIATDIGRHGGAFGYGPGSFKLILPTSPYFQSDLYSRWVVTNYDPRRAVGQWNHACNDLLETWIEVGPVGLILFLSIPFAAMFALFRSSNRMTGTSERVTYQVSFVALAMLAVHALGDSPLQSCCISIGGAIFVSLGWSLLMNPHVEAVLS